MNGTVTLELSQDTIMYSESSAVQFVRLNVTCSDYCTILKDREIVNNRCLIFPNPTSGKIYVRTDKLKHVEILNMQGKEIYSGVENEMDISFNSPGIYIIKVITDNQIVTKKIIKQ